MLFNIIKAYKNQIQYLKHQKKFLQNQIIKYSKLKFSFILSIKIILKFISFFLNLPIDQSMLGLGRDVLKKIQNLLVQIDKGQSKPSTNQKSKSKKKNGMKNSSTINNLKKSKRKVFEVQQKENLCSSRIEQLYLNHFIKQDRRLNKNIEIYEEELKNLKPFHVENKISHFLNKKQNLKPIYERTNDILLKREKSIQKIKQNAPKNKDEAQQEQLYQIELQRSKKHKRLTKQQFQAKMQEIETRKIARMKKTQQMKLLSLEQKHKAYFEKPQITSTTKKCWQKKQLKKNLSSNVFERFQQYDYQRKQNWEKYLDRRKKEQTPFTPKISEVTKQLAERSRSRKSLHQKMSRSHSCRVLSKNEVEELSLIEKKQDSFTQRSLSKNRHLKSTTVNSSRNHLNSNFTRMSIQRREKY